MGPEEAGRRVDSGEFAVVDVRGSEEFANGHIPGAFHCHLGMLAEKSEGLPKVRPILVTCRAGARSSIGQSLLLGQGVENVVNLEGGWSAWREAGLPSEG